MGKMMLVFMLILCSIGWLENIPFTVVVVVVVFVIIIIIIVIINFFSTFDKEKYANIHRYCRKVKEGIRIT